MKENLALDKSISKSDYIKGLQCSKALWFFNYRKDLKLPLDDKTKAKFETGNEITELARKYFTEGVKAVDDYFDVKKAADSTKNLIAKNHQIIFEATAIIDADGSHARIDIFRKNQNSDGWDLIEVKSSTGIEDYHLDDMSFQYHVFSKAGYKIDRCLLMLIDNSYVLQGEIDVSKFFKFEDVSKQILEKQNEVDHCKNDLLEVLKTKEEPKIIIGDKCFKPFECDFKHHCWKEVPKYSIFKIYQNKKAEEIAKQIGSYDIKDIPQNLFPSGAKVIDINCHQENKTHIDKAKIKGWLSKLQYPLYFLDYETFNSAIPVFDGTRPYQQIPFQFSLHIQDAPDSEPRHFEFIHKEKSDPRRNFAKKLIEVCAKEGSIVCYHQSFEKGRNDDLAKDFPEYAESLKQINARIVDLIEPFRGRFIYSPKQQSSYSIKEVLPSFTNHSYHEMEIANGGEAMEIYLNFLKGKNVDEAKMVEDLLSYCKLDTYAMVELVKVLLEHS
jgi:hypothetical protein